MRIIFIVLSFRLACEASSNNHRLTLTNSQYRSSRRESCRAVSIYLSHCIRIILPILVCDVNSEFICEKTFVADTAKYQVQITVDINSAHYRPLHYEHFVHLDLLSGEHIQPQNLRLELNNIFSGDDNYVCSSKLLSLCICQAYL